MEAFKLESSNIDLGPNFTDAKESLIKFKDSIEKLKEHKNDPSLHIHEYFTNLRNEVDLEKENIQEKTDENFLKLIGEIDYIEYGFNDNISKKNEEIMTDIDTTEMKFKKLESDLDELKIDIQKWNNIRVESEFNSEKIQRKISNFKNDILNHKIYFYKKAKFDIEEILKESKITSFGLDITRKYDEFGSFHFTLNQFKKFSKTVHFEPNKFISKLYIFNRIKWYGSIENVDGQYLKCHIKSEHEDEHKMIDGTFSIQLNNKNPDQNRYREYEQKICEDVGSNTYITFDDIYNNGFYDEENDSIDFSIFIQIKQKISHESPVKRLGKNRSCKI